MNNDKKEMEMVWLMIFALIGLWLPLILKGC